MKNMSTKTFIKRVIEQYHRDGKRFMIKVLVKDIMNRLGHTEVRTGRKVIDEGEVHWVGDQTKYQEFHKMTNTVLNSIRDENRRRIFIHSIDPKLANDPSPTWFGVDQSTPEEEIAFGLWLQGKAGKTDKDGGYFISDGRRRLRKSRRVMKDA